MLYNILVFVSGSKPGADILIRASYRIKAIYGYDTKTMNGCLYVAVSHKKDIPKVTAFCYGMRELWRIIERKVK